MVDFFDRRGRLAELVAAARRERPRLAWPDMAPPRPAGSAPVAPFELAPFLRQLERRYASVYREEARLHDEPAEFLLADLRGPLRGEAWVQALVARAVGALQARVERLGRPYESIEARCEDEGWAKAAQALTFFLFWQEEDGGLALAGAPLCGGARVQPHVTRWPAKRGGILAGGHGGCGAEAP